MLFEDFHKPQLLSLDTSHLDSKAVDRQQSAWLSDHRLNPSVWSEWVSDREVKPKTRVELLKDRETKPYSWSEWVSDLEVTPNARFQLSLDHQPNNPSTWSDWTSDREVNPNARFELVLDGQENPINARFELVSNHEVNPDTQPEWILTDPGTRSETQPVFRIRLPEGERSETISDETYASALQNSTHLDRMRARKDNMNSNLMQDTHRKSWRRQQQVVVPHQEVVIPRRIAPSPLSLGLDLGPSVCADGSEFSCDDGTCIPSWCRCDGIPHCFDGSDEYYCYYTTRPTITRRLSTHRPRPDSREIAKQTLFAFLLMHAACDCVQS